MTDHAIYEYVPHRRTKEKLEGADKPVKVAGQLPVGGGTARFNGWLAVKVTNGVDALLQRLINDATTPGKA
jgi:hypothetical protein